MLPGVIWGEAFGSSSNLKIKVLERLKMKVKTSPQRRPGRGSFRSRGIKH